MEAIKDQSSCPPTSAGSKLRYPLRSSGKSKDGKPAMVDASDSSASRRGRPLSSVSQSVGVLDLSAKDKSAKPPRRLSIPTRSNFSPHQASVGSITPISEARMSRSNTRGKSDTPLSDASKSTSRRKFSVLSSVSYWLTQIKLSESASKHSISLGFFKLALESGCEPQRIREELKSYVLRHNLLAELGEPAKDLLQSYNILEDFEQLKLSETGSQLPKEGTQISNQDVHSSSATARAGHLKPKSLISNTFTVAESNKKEIVQKIVPAAKGRPSNVKGPARPVSVKDANGNNMQKKSRKPKGVESNNGNAKIKSSMKESTSEEVDPLPTEDALNEDKENMDAPAMEGAGLKEEIQPS